MLNHWASSTELDAFQWAEVPGPAGSERPDQVSSPLPPFDQFPSHPPQVRVSPCGQSVWLFSSKSGLCWMRSGLGERNWRGKDWAQVFYRLSANKLTTKLQASQAPKVSELAVTGNSVWALERGTFKLHRLSAQSGHWHCLDFKLQALSVDTLEQRLWALDTQFRLVRHKVG